MNLSKGEKKQMYKGSIRAKEKKEYIEHLENLLLIYTDTIIELTHQLGE